MMRIAFAVNTAAVYVAAPEEWKAVQCDQMLSSAGKAYL